MTKNRVEAFSDGVFAIVITLLVIELRPPELEHGESLASGLWDMWPSYIAYITSFAVIGVMWLNHHRIFTSVRVVDGGLLVLNLNLLLWMALIPFPTAVVADFIREGDANASTAVAFYSGVILLAAISYTLLFVWILHDDRIVGARLDPTAVRTARARFGVGIVFYSVALVLSFIWPWVALGLHFVLATYYVINQGSVPQGEPA